jgi:hypothetical protein
MCSKRESLTLARQAFGDSVFLGGILTVQQQMIPLPRPGVNSGPDRRPSIPRRVPIPEKLVGPDRRAWEAVVFATPGLKGSRAHVARVILDESCWGKPWSYASCEWIAAKARLSVATVYRCMDDLVKLGVVWWIKDGRKRWIVFRSHPHAAVFLKERGLEPALQDESGPSQPEDQPPQPEGEVSQTARQIVLVKPGAEPHVAAEPPTEISLPGPNEERPDPEPAATYDWRKIVADLGGSIPTPVAKPTRPARPAIDPAERAAIMAEALKPPQGHQDAPGEALEPSEDRSIDPAAEQQGGPYTPAHPDHEQATIAAIERIGPGARPGEIIAVVGRLVNLFSDPGSRAYYVSVCQEVVRGQLLARVLAAAVRSACGPGIRNRGAAFVAHIKRCRTAAARRRR